MAQLYGENPPAADFDDLAARVTAVMEQMWTRCLRIGVDVVLDFGFWTRAERMRARALVERSGGRAALYRLQCPHGIAKERVASRNRQESGGLHIATATYDILFERFEPLGEDEPRIDVAP